MHPSRKPIQSWGITVRLRVGAPSWRSIAVALFVAAAAALAVLSLVPTEPQRLVLDATLLPDDVDPQGLTIHYIEDRSSPWATSLSMSSNRRVIAPTVSTAVGYECGLPGEVQRMVEELAAEDGTQTFHSPVFLPRPGSSNHLSLTPRVLARVEGQQLSVEATGGYLLSSVISYQGQAPLTIVLRRSRADSALRGSSVWQLALAADEAGGVFESSDVILASRQVSLDSGRIDLEFGEPEEFKVPVAATCIGLWLDGAAATSMLYPHELTGPELAARAEVWIELPEGDAYSEWVFPGPDVPEEVKEVFAADAGPPFGMYLYASSLRIRRMPAGSLTTGATSVAIARYSEFFATGNLRLELKPNSGHLTIEGDASEVRVNGETLIPQGRIDLRQSTFAAAAFVVVALAGSFLGLVTERALTRPTKSG